MKTFLKKYQLLVFLILALLCLWFDHILHEGAYSKLSFIGIVLLSSAFLLICFKLIHPLNNLDFLIIKYAGSFILLLGILNCVFDLAYAWLFGFLMPDIINFSCGLITLGVSMMLWKPNVYSDEKLSEATTGTNKNEVAIQLIRQAPALKKTTWLLFLAVGVIVGEMVNVAGFFR